MKKKISIILLAVLLVLALASLVACGEKEFTVTIDLQNGTEPTTQVVPANGTVDLPNMEDETYREFHGWFTSPDATGSWSKSNKVTSNITIYACWNAITGKVTFNLNYKDAPKAETKNLPLGQAIDVENPTREYWVFTGWYTDAETTTAYDMDAILTASTLTLYAGWESEAGHTHDYTDVTTPVSCLLDGYDTHTCYCGHEYVDNIVPATGHDFDFDANDYMGMVTCSNDDCDVAERLESLRTYDDVFVFEFDAEKEAEIDARYQDMLDILAALDRYNEDEHYYDFESGRYMANKAFEEVYNAFYDDLIYLIEQYQYSYVFYCVDDSEANTQAYEHIGDYRTEKVSDFYALYRLIYETEFREFFFAESEGWTQEDIEQALIMSDSYGGDEYVEINNRINEIEIEFREIADPSKDSKVLSLYAEFIKLKNQSAEIAGYDNYIEYAYENVYSRDYSPADTKVMRDNVKKYLIDVFNSIYDGYYATGSTSVKNEPSKSYYNALKNDSIFDSKLTTDLVQGFFKKMNSNAGATPIDFYKHANDLFKNGNYYTGDYEGAFSYWISAQDTSILYFGPNSYSGAFTFVHEFGHYYNNVYNKGIGMSYDLEEVHSQANEMMFLSYLKTTLPENVRADIFDKIYYDNLYNMFAIIMFATAVDEFEYCVYTNTTPDGEPTQYLSFDYDRLFKDIMKSYGIDGYLNSAYWRYVVIEAPCYYISYAMSALPCVELLSIADTQGFEVAQEKYFKFFTFTDVADHVELDEAGDKVIKIGYEDTLKYVGLNSIFGEDLYKALSTYFVKADEA